MPRFPSRLVLAGAAALLLVLPSHAAAAAPSLDDTSNQWMPSSDGAQWTWSWSDSAYQPAPRTELYGVDGREGRLFRVSWSEPNPPAGETAQTGAVVFQQGDGGLLTRNYAVGSIPTAFPVLCASTTSCQNTVSGPLWMLIWGTQSPTLAEPLVRGTRWSSTGGQDGDVVSDNRYTGRARVKVPAFPGGVRAAKVVSRITQAGALGDPYGSGVRTVWWVRGVGPVRIEFRHTGGELTRAVLQSTSLKPRPMPSDANFFPLTVGDHATYRWRNSRYMRSWSRERFDVAKNVNNSALVQVKRLSGPINVAGGYVLSSRLSGVTSVSGATKAATRAKFPAMGSRANPRHFFTPYDLMIYGLNPVLPAYPAKGDSWRSSHDSDAWDIYHVAGSSTVLGRRRVRTPAGTFRAVVVRSSLHQKGHPFGSGTRTSWFAPGKGLVKLVFRHADGSVSTVERER